MEYSAVILMMLILREIVFIGHVLKIKLLILMKNVQYGKEYLYNNVFGTEQMDAFQFKPAINS